MQKHICPLGHTGHVDRAPASGANKVSRGTKTIMPNRKSFLATTAGMAARPAPAGPIMVVFIIVLRSSAAGTADLGARPIGLCAMVANYPFPAAGSGPRTNGSVTPMVAHDFVGRNFDHTRHCSIDSLSPLGLCIIGRELQA